MGKILVENVPNEFNGLNFIRYVVMGLERIMGNEAAKSNLYRAGRIRGLEIINNLDLCLTSKPLSEWSSLFSQALSQDGTCVCSVKKVEYDEACYRVYLNKFIRSINEEQELKSLFSFTQGVIQGGLEALTGKRFSGVNMTSAELGGDVEFVEFKIR